MQTPEINAETPSDLATPEQFTRKQALANDEAQGFRDPESSESPDCHSAPHAGQALRVIEGEQRVAHARLLQGDREGTGDAAMSVEV